jgi:hypothetical protein
MCGDDYIKIKWNGLEMRRLWDWNADTHENFGGPEQNIWWLSRNLGSGEELGWGISYLSSLVGGIGTQAISLHTHSNRLLLLHYPQ